MRSRRGVLRSVDEHEAPAVGGGFFVRSSAIGRYSTVTVQVTSGTARAEFTIMLGSMTYLDAGPESGSGDQLGYAVFGRVVEGMAVVRAIFSSPVSPTEGEGHMRGQMLSPRIRILTARRLPAAP